MSKRMLFCFLTSIWKLVVLYRIVRVSNYCIIVMSEVYSSVWMQWLRHDETRPCGVYIIVYAVGRFVGCRHTVLPDCRCCSRSYKWTTCKGYWTAGETAFVLKAWVNCRGGENHFKLVDSLGFQPLAEWLGFTRAYVEMFALEKRFILLRLECVALRYFVASINVLKHSLPIILGLGLVKWSIWLTCMMW